MSSMRASCPLMRCSVTVMRAQPTHTTMVQSTSAAPSTLARGCVRRRAIAASSDSTIVASWTCTAVRAR